MKLTTINGKSSMMLCPKCGKGFMLREKVWKVSTGCNPKYYHERCKPKEY